MPRVGIALSSYLPAAPQPGADDQETIANLVKALREMIAGIYEYDQRMNTSPSLGFTSASDGTTTIDAIDDATLFLVGGDAVTVDYATGQLVFKVAEDTTEANKLMSEINAHATTKISAGLIVLTSATDWTGADLSDLDSGQDTKLDGVATGADVTSANNQPSAWLTTKLEPGEIRITSGGDTVLLENMLVDYANDWTDDNPSGLYLTTQFMGFFNTTTNTWPSVINNDGTVSFFIDSLNEISHDGSFVTVKAEKGRIGGADSFFDISNEFLQLKVDGQALYSYFDATSVTFSTGTAGSGTVKAQWTNVAGNMTLDFNGSATHTPLFRMRSLGVGLVEVIHMAANDTEVDILFTNRAGTSYLDLDSSAVIRGFTFTSCVLAAASGTTIDASLVNAGTLGAVNGSNVTNIGGSNVSGGTFGAVNGSALTALNATQLTTGTVPTARLPFQFQHGEYTGTGNSAVETKFTFNFTPTFVIVRREASQEATMHVYAAVGDAAALSDNINNGAIHSSTLFLDGTALKTNGTSTGYNAVDEYHVIGFA